MVKVNAAGATSSSHHAPANQGPRTEAPLLRAWISLALIPVFFLLSFAAQTGIYALTGYDPSTGTVPLWASLTAGLPGLALVLIPCIAGVIYGRRAVGTGVRAGLVPAVLAGLVAVAMIVLTVANI